MHSDSAQHIHKAAVTDELRGKVAIVTGSTSGIGLGIAQAFAARGMNVVLNGFGDRIVNEQVCTQLSVTHGIKAVFSPADMAKPREISGMVDLANRTFGQIDVLVNNAGIQHVEAIETFPPEKWEAILAINLSSAFYTTQAVVPQMKARRWGRIINVASAHALVASPFKSAYVAAKHGILGFTKAIALETAEHGITVNAICPGYVLTPLVQKQLGDRAKAGNMTMEAATAQLLGEKEPSLQFTTPEELGALAVFFCSPAGNNVRGVAWNMDGGWVAQ